ncbi:hypothetical protein NKH14_07070 [Mesorhizobium sp. M1380]|uniref:hypothetical protein n=1 Tax=Mesorhizobium sp. M1380 TaxID=2957093 RepID=UPI00333BA0C8
MKFQYLEIRPCVEHGGATRSFLGEPEFHAGIGDKVCTPHGAEIEAEAFRATQNGEAGPIFWTIYGRCTEGMAHAIGDFSTFAAAEEVMNAILAPMAEARDQLNAGQSLTRNHAGLVNRIDYASATLEDFINQCSNSERLR